VVDPRRMEPTGRAGDDARPVFAPGSRALDSPTRDQPDLVGADPLTVHAGGIRPGWDASRRPENRLRPGEPPTTTTCLPAPARREARHARFTLTPDRSDQTDRAAWPAAALTGRTRVIPGWTRRDRFEPDVPRDHAIAPSPSRGPRRRLAATRDHRRLISTRRVSGDAEQLGPLLIGLSPAAVRGTGSRASRPCRSFRACLSGRATGRAIGHMRAAPGTSSCTAIRRRLPDLASTSPTGIISLFDFRFS
jgi:hypothetical protein